MMNILKGKVLYITNTYAKFVGAFDLNFFMPWFPHEA